MRSARVAVGEGGAGAGLLESEEAEHRASQVESHQFQSKQKKSTTQPPLRILFYIEVTVGIYTAERWVLGVYEYVSKSVFSVEGGSYPCGLSKSQLNVRQAAWLQVHMRLS